jgi:hypothetical protein
MTALNRQEIESRIAELQDDLLSSFASQDARARENMGLETVEQYNRVASDDAKHLERIRANMREQHGLLVELAEQGVCVPSVGYLVSYDDAPPYAHTIPILLKHLARDDYSGHTFMCLAAALGIPEARVHWDELVRLFKTTNVTTHPQKKSNIAQTLGTLATRKQLAEVIDILKDPSHGASARRQLAFPVLKSRSQMALQCRADLRDDPDIGEFMNRKKLFADDDD